MVAYHLSGVEPGAVVARSMQMSDLQAEMSGLRDQITKLQRRYDRLAQEGQDQAAAVSRSDQMASRAAPFPPGLVDVGERIAAAQREVAVQQRADAILARARRRPASRVSSRSASPPKVLCTESTGDYWDPCPAHGGVNHGRDVERPAASRAAAEAELLIEKGYSPRMAYLAQREITRYGGPVVSVR